MKKITLITVFLFAHVWVSAQGFTVKNYTADFYLNAEGYFDVEEKYDVEFSEAKHGLFREIITNYKLQDAEGNIQKRKLVIENIDVPGHHFEVSSKLEQRTEDKVVIKIGDKDKFVTGLQHYEIRYRVYNAFLFENDIVQFYWNLKPSGWLTIFKEINFNIHTPEGSVLSAENCFVYAGIAGTTSLSTDFDYSYSTNIFSGKSHPFFFSAPGQDVTVLIKLPRNLIKENFITPSLWQQYGWVGILACLLIIFWLVWLKYGKDDKVISVTSYYPPKGIDPAMAGYLIDDKEDGSDLIALLPHWAAQGFIKMEEIPKKGWFGKVDMKLIKTGQPPLNMPEYERKIFDGLFNIWGNVVLVSSLTNSFYVIMNEAKKLLKSAAQKYYEAKSNKVMKITTGIAIALGVVLAGIFLFWSGIVAAVSAAITCVFIAFMSFFLQKKNAKGNAVLSELKGFKQFIRMAEVNRIKTLIEQDPNYFEKTMSYALAFGLLDNWAKKFEALNVPPPNWYSSSGTTMLGMHAFSKSFSGTMTSTQSSMVSSPSSSSSSGGGSSGGGFGGGGGGSW